MSLGFSGKIGEYAEEMGEWVACSPSWYREAIVFLGKKEMWQRLIDVLECLKIDPLKPMTRGQETGVMALAIAYGAEFTFYDSSSANDFIVRMLNKWSIDLEVPIHKLYTPLERLQLGLNNG